MKLQIRANRPMWSDDIQLAIIATSHDGNKAVADPLTMRRIEPGQHIGEPTIRLHLEDAQLLMDELWGVGLRPAEGKGSAGQLEATRAHLEDMRRLVFEVPTVEIKRA